MPATQGPLVFRRLGWIGLTCLWFHLASGFCPAAPATEDVRQLIRWLLAEDRDLQAVPFRGVIEATSGKTVRPVKPEDAADQGLLREIGAALDAVLVRLNDPAHPAHRQARINEVSAHFESALLEELNRRPGFRCAVPKTAEGRTQRSGYPDLRLEDTRSGRVIYLDPKLYAADSRESSLRTFYFEPKRGTNKVLDEAHHLLIGVEHGGREGRVWKFARWEIVDLSQLHVRLKAEFQAANRDIYQPSAIVGQSGKGD